MRTLPLFAALTLAASAALAAPFAVRPRPAPLPTSPGKTAAPPDHFCGTRTEALAEAMADALARPEVQPLATTFTRDAGEIAVIEDDGTLFYTNSGGRRLLDLAAVMRAFYRTHGDDYDQVAIYLSTGQTQWLGSPGALAAAWFVRNDTQGIGLSLYDFGSAFASPSRLQQVLTMNGLGRYPADQDSGIGGPTDSFSTMDVLAHEFAHRWSSYVFVDSAGSTSPALLGRDWQHWSFFADVDSSFMEGCDWTEVAPDSFRTTGVSSTFGRLDRYVMGVLAPEEMDSVFVVNDPTAFDPPGTYIPITTPFVGLGARGRKTWWGVDDIERVHGPRVPHASVAPHQFRVAFALVTPPGTDATPADLAKLDAIRLRFPGFVLDATGQRMSVDVSLDSRPGRVAFAHAPLPDTELPGAPRPVAARITVEDGGLGLVVDPASVTLWWRNGSAGPFSAVPMGAAGPDSFAAAIPPAPAGVVEYYLEAAAFAAPAVTATLPAAGASAPFAYVAGPDGTPPELAHTPPVRIGVDQLPHRLLARAHDNLGLDSVWCDLSVNGGATQRLAAARSGPDSFSVVLPGGMPVAGRFAYRFVARDVAAAPNTVAHAAAAESLIVSRSAFEDFENGADWFHQNVLFSWRDSWRPVTDPTAPAGPAVWKCGSPDATPYGPHLDAVLYTPWFASVPAGTTLEFDHRWELEAASATRAWDAARLEIQVGTGAAAWTAVAPAPGYTHTQLGSGMPFASGSPCWSGTSPGWVRATLDLTPWAGQNVRFRFRMTADDFLGFDGWRVDRVRVLVPGDVTLDAPLAAGAAFATSRAWPNPATTGLAQALTLPRRAEVEWTLHDVQGRRVATLWRGVLEPGERTLEAALPPGIASGIYLSRVRADAQTSAPRRIALIR